MRRRLITALLMPAGLLVACQAPPAAPTPAPDDSGFSARQIQVLQAQGFRKVAAGWQLDLAMSLLFDFDSDRLQPAQRERLTRLAVALVGVDLHRLHVEGHTDNVGLPPYNQALSLRRARQVADVVVAAGMDPRTVQARGFGMDRPIADSRTEAGRAQNRRVSLIVSP